MPVRIIKFPLHTVRYLLDALKPAGSVCGFMTLTDNGATRMEYPVMLMKMPLIDTLRGMKTPDAKTAPFWIRIDDEQYHSRIVFIGREAPAE